MDIQERTLKALGLRKCIIYVTMLKYNNLQQFEEEEINQSLRRWKKFYEQQRQLIKEDLVR